MRRQGGGRAFMLMALACAVALSGCVTGTTPAADAETDTGARAPPAAVEVPVELTDCMIPEAFIEVPAERVRPHVPDDFALTPDDADRVLVILGGLVCGPDGSGSSRAIVAVRVEPLDDALRHPDATNYFWEPEHHLVTGSAITDAFLEVGAEPTMVDAVSSAVTLTHFELAITHADWAHRVEGAPGARPGGEVIRAFPSFREYSQADGGYAYLQAEFGADDGATLGFSPATVTTGAGTVAREIIGPEASALAFSGDGLTYLNARVGFVPR